MNYREFRPTQSFFGSLAKEVAPLVEKVVGSRFKAFPTVRPAVSDEVLGYLREELHPHTLVCNAIADGEAARAHTEYVAIEMSETILAKYRSKGNLILVQPGIFQRQAEIFNRPECLEPDFVRLILAHECVHALDEQDCQSSTRCARPLSRDQSQVWGALMEGHAQFVTAQVAKELGLVELFALYEAMITMPAPDLSEADQYRQQWRSRYASFQYHDGRRFFEHHAARKSNVRETVFANLPATKQMIVRPELYPAGSPVRPKRDLKKLWDDLRGEDEEGWRSGVLELDEFDLRWLTKRYLSDLDASFFGELRNGEVLIFNDGVNVFGEEVICSIWEGPSADWSTQALKIFLDLSRKKDEHWRRGEGKILSHQYSQETVNGFDEAWHVEKVHSSDSVSVSLHYVFLRLGRFCIWVTMNGEPVEESDIREALVDVATYLREEVA